MEHVPSFHLYGETADQEPRFWFHCETIRSRSSKHRWEIRVHRHEQFFQILYIAAGSGDAVIDNHTYLLEPPSLTLLPPGRNHGFRFSKDVEGLVLTVSKWHLANLIGERGRLADWLSSPHIAALDPQNADASYLIQTVERIADEFGRGDKSSSELLGTYIALAVRLCARFSQDDTDQPAATDGEKRMERFYALIQQHLRSHKPLSFYAANLGMSLTHLNRTVRVATGQSPHELISAKLLEQSKRELLFSMATIQEIGLRLGFEDPAYFSRFFSKHTGETPGVWRRREKQRLDAREPEILDA